jgi:hypothetical protein
VLRRTYIACLALNTHQFSIQKCCVLPTQCFLCFVWIWEQTAIISLHSINWLVFITETECVYYAVRIEYLNVIQVYMRIRGLSPVSHREEAGLVPVHVRIVVDKVALQQVVYQIFGFRSHSTSAPYSSLIRRTSGWSLRAFKQRNTLVYIVDQGRE